MSAPTMDGTGLVSYSCIANCTSDAPFEMDHALLWTTRIFGEGRIRSPSISMNRIIPIPTLSQHTHRRMTIKYHSNNLDIRLQFSSVCWMFKGWMVDTNIFWISNSKNSVIFLNSTLIFVFCLILKFYFSISSNMSICEIIYNRNDLYQLICIN